MSNHSLIQNEDLRARLDRLYSMCVHACDARTSTGAILSADKRRKINAYGAAIANLSSSTAEIRLHVSRLLSLANNGIRG